MKRSTAEATLKKMPPEFDIDLLPEDRPMEQVEKGMAEIKAGKGIPHSKVMASFKRKWRK